MNSQPTRNFQFVNNKEIENTRMFERFLPKQPLQPINFTEPDDRYVEHYIPNQSLNLNKQNVNEIWISSKGESGGSASLSEAFKIPENLINSREYKIENEELAVKGDICIYDDWYYTKDKVAEINGVLFYLGRTNKQVDFDKPTKGM